jgi:hypothetical protein
MLTWTPCWFQAIFAGKDAQQTNSFCIPIDDLNDFCVDVVRAISKTQGEALKAFYSRIAGIAAMVSIY